jgi:tripartite-type tricarboxylate transporter receptor subunit TctC
MKQSFKSLFATGIVALGVTGVAVGTAHAQGAEDFPSKPVQYVIPFGPGGESDQSARMQQPYFEEMFGANLVVSYKPGGGGAVGWSQLNGYEADGYTIMGINLPHIIIKPMVSDVGFETDDLGVFHIFHYTPDAIVVNKDSPFKTLEDLVSYAKENPGRLTFSGSGKGTANDMAHILFDDLADITTTYIPFKGTGASVTALLGEQVSAAWGYTTIAAQHPENTRLLAVAMEERHPLFPDVPTFKELGYDMVGGAYRGMAVPVDTPEAIKQKLSDMFSKINNHPEFQEKMTNRGFALIDITLDEVDEFLAKKAEEYRKLAETAGLLQE